MLTLSKASQDISQTHASVFELQRAMASDAAFEFLCRKHGLPWNAGSGYEPRWYNGPPPAEARVLVLMAEPGAPSRAVHLSRTVAYSDWLAGYDLQLPDHYWRANLLQLCRYIWPSDTEAKMVKHLAGSCTFWMSLPEGGQTKPVPGALINYFSEHYLRRFLALFTNAVVLAAGKKAHERLTKLGIPHESCWAFTRPGCNQKMARDSWREAGSAIRETLAARTAAPWL